MHRKSYRAVHGLILLVVLAGSACRNDDVAGPARPAPIDSSSTQILQGLPGQVTFSTFLGGSQQDQIRDVATDAQGNVYVVGGTQSPNFPTTSGAFDRTRNGNYDVFVSKFSSSGQLLASTFIGGSGYDRAYAVEVDAHGYVVVAGRSGGGLPATTGHFGPTFKGGVAVGVYGPQDGFVCKLTPNLNAVVFCGYIGTKDEFILRDVAVDPLGNIYTPYIADSVGIPSSWTVGGYLPTFPHNNSILLVKISSDGNTVLGGTWFGGSGSEYGNPSVRWFNGRVYLLGRTASTNLPTPGGFDHSLGGPWDMYLAVFPDNLKSLSFATYVGGSKAEDSETHNLAVDASGNAFIAAGTSSTDLPGTTGHFQARSAGSNDAFVMKISPTGGLMAATYYGGISSDLFQGVEVDNAGRVFMSTNTQSLIVPITANPLGSLKLGSAGLVVMSNNLDVLMFAEFLGGSDSDDARAIALAPGGSVVLGGMTSSINWYLRAPFQGGFGGGKLDGMVFRFAGF